MIFVDVAAVATALAVLSAANVAAAVTYSGSSSGTTSSRSRKNSIHINSNSSRSCFETNNQDSEAAALEQITGFVRTQGSQHRTHLITSRTHSLQLEGLGTPQALKIPSPRAASSTWPC